MQPLHNGLLQSGRADSGLLAVHAVLRVEADQELMRSSRTMQLLQLCVRSGLAVHVVLRVVADPCRMRRCGTMQLLQF